MNLATFGSLLTIFARKEPMLYVYVCVCVYIVPKSVPFLILLLVLYSVHCVSGVPLLPRGLCNEALQFMFS